MSCIGFCILQQESIDYINTKQFKSVSSGYVSGVLAWPHAFLIGKLVTS